MSNIFNSVPTKSPNRMRNHLTPVNTMSFNFGGIYPIFCKTVLPGDRWSMGVQSFVRTVPLLSPVMSRNDLKIDAFFVPFRLIWKSAEKWHGCDDETIRRPMIHAYEGLNTADVYESLLGESSLNDYLGFASIPIVEFGASPHKRKVCALPFRAYRFIYDYYFRNKAVEKAITEFDDWADFYGDDDIAVDRQMMSEFLTNDTLKTTILDSVPKVLLRPWRRDIFTSALPDPQNGSDVLIPQADIVEDGKFKLDNPSSSLSVLYEDSDGTLVPYGGDSQSYKSGLKLDPSGPTIRQLRYASYLEEFEEAQARGGSNKGFKEWLRNIWGVKSSDARLDRPEYLGGYRGPIQISEVPQTSAATNSSPQGTLAGKGLSVGGQRLFHKMFFEEPGIVMVLMSVVPKTAYCQGDPREWLYESPFDFPNPFFDNLGEQEVKLEELLAYAAYDSGVTNHTFGYNVRNYEMKSYPDEIHGACRSSLSYWHEGRIFQEDNYPGLNPDFLKVHPEDVSRIFPSSENSDKLIGQFYFDIRQKRNLSWYGLPKFG